MTRPTRSYGRPGTPVFPPEWSDSHGVVSGKTWTSMCRVLPPAGSGATATIAANLSVTLGTPTAPLYDGACRVQVLNAQESRAVLGDQDQSTVSYLVVVSRTWDVPHGAVLEVYEADEDPTLVGRRLVVRKVDRGSTIWERDVYAVEDQTAPDPVVTP